MTTVITLVLVVGVPFALVSALLGLVEQVQRRRNRVIARQIALTDAIHRDLGAIAAPIVERRLGGWRVAMAVPFERPGTVAGLVRVTHRFFARQNDADDTELEIVLRAAPQRSQPSAIPIWSREDEVDNLTVAA